MPPAPRNVLTVNTGSSSLKAAVYRLEDEHIQRTLSALAERIGSAGSTLEITRGEQPAAVDNPQALADHSAALSSILAQFGNGAFDAAGHRVVHGGSRYSRPERIDAALVASLRELLPIDPMHLPQAIDTIELLTRLEPDIPQVACFDTAFHRPMPRLAQLYALPRELTDAGVIRYGFHGLSYEYIVEQLSELDPTSASGRTIVAHLGNGASMAAIRDGRSIDTTMGFTPTGGLVMGTRSGDMDPGVLIHLAATRRLDSSQLSELLNKRSGLLGVSGQSGDMRALLAAEAADPHAAEAVDLFCYRGRQFIGSLAAVLGGVDTLVFTGGIGEHAAPVRWRMCQGLEFLGIGLDQARNAASAPVISTNESAVKVRVIPTDEDLMIVRHTARLLWG
jgi:acetate kinase